MNPKDVDITTKRVVVLDWDGTLFDSMPTKRQTFAQAYQETFPSHEVSLTVIQSHYQQLSGLSRVLIFNQICEELGLPHTPAEWDVFNASLKLKNMTQLQQARLFEGVESFLSNLQKEGKIIYISSSVPSVELKSLVAAKVPEAVIPASQVLGSDGDFSKGIGHLTWIMGKTGVEAADLIVIGDDIHDYLLSKAAGVEALVIDREARYLQNDFATIPNFSCLVSHKS